MQVLIKPLITEKAELLAEKSNKYTFIVDKKANKIQIKKSVEEMYNVNVVAVNTARMPGKVKVKGTRKGYQVGRLSSYKKALVSVEEGDTIDVYSNI